MDSATEKIVGTGTVQEWFQESIACVKRTLERYSGDISEVSSKELLSVKVAEVEGGDCRVHPIDQNGERYTIQKEKIGGWVTNSWRM